MSDDSCCSDVLQAERGGTPFPLTKTKRRGTPLPLTRTKPFDSLPKRGGRRSSPHYVCQRIYLFNDEGHAFLKIKYVSFKETLATVFVTFKIVFCLWKFWNLYNPNRN